MTEATISLKSQQAEEMNDVEKDSGKITADMSQHSPKVEKPAQSISTTDWDGPDDPENPWNWPFWKKAYHTSIPAFQSFAITFSSSVYTPGVPDVAKSFSVSTVVAFLPLTVSVLGLAFGPAISAPLSETFGRRAVYIIFFLPSLLFTLGAGFAQNIGTLIVCRLLAGIMGAGCLAVGAGTNSDLWNPMQRARASAFYVMTPSLGSALGPPVGGYAVMEKGWRWTQWCVLFVGAFSYLLCLPQKETYKKIILQQRAKRLGLPPPQDNLPTGVAKLKVLLVITVLRPMHMIVTEPIVSLLSLFTAFNFAVLFGFFGAFPLVFESPYPEIQVYHFNTGESGLVFLAFAVGVIIATAIFIVIDFTYRKRTRERRAAGDNTPLPAEERLTAAIIGAPMLPISLFWFAWTARASIHWICCVISTVLYGIGFTLVFFAVMLYLIDVYGAKAGASAAAANGLMRYVLAGVFPLFITQMYRGIGVGWATSIFGFVTIVLAPLPWVFTKFGAQIRQHSSYAS
ncbi:MFS transporter [Xylogone sp. PMI_703]|nr:MFS transporter [Xylogone sp. PMI_703]